MIGIWSSHAQIYLLVFAILTTVFFAIPIFFKPILWARAMLWNIPDDTDLAVHIYGAIKKIQPITETLENILWIALLVLTLCFFPDS